MAMKARRCPLPLLALLFLAHTAKSMSFNDIPLPAITDQTGVWIRGHVVSVESNGLADNERYKFDSNGATEVTVVIRVSDSAPKTAETNVTAHWATMPEFVRRIVEDRECVAALVRREDGTYKSLWALGLYGWYQPGPDSDVIDRVGSTLTNIPASLLWDLVSTLRTGLDASGGPAASVRDQWLPRLESGSLAEFAAAQMVFDTFPALELSPEVMMNALERQHARFQERVANSTSPYEETDAFRRALAPAFALLMRLGGPATTERLVALCVRDFSGEESALDESETCKRLTAVICARGGDARVAQLTALLGKQFSWKSEDGRRTRNRVPLRADYGNIKAIGEHEGADLDALLLDMLRHPANFAMNDTLSLAAVWNALAARGNPEIKTYLDAFIAAPDAFPLGIRREESRQNTMTYAREALDVYARNLPRPERIQEGLRLYRQGDLGALGRALSLVTIEDKQLVPVLSSIPLEHISDAHQNIPYYFCSMATIALPDPAFLPQLRALAESNRNGYVLEALDACGDPALARSLAVKLLESTLPSRDWRAVYDGIGEQTSVISFLGERNNPELAPVIDPFTRPALLDDYREKLIAASKAEGKEPHDWAVRDLEKCAILALARAGGPTAAPRLREIYANGDIAARIVAAMGLHARGDDTGRDLVRRFAEHRELEDPEIAARWRVDLFGIFHFACKYLQNFRTDAVLLERIERGFDDSDHDLAGYDAFIEMNRPIVLRALVNNLDSKDARLRSDAARLLEDITRHHVDYDPQKLPLQQQAAIAQWRDWIYANSNPK